MWVAGVDGCKAGWIVAARDVRGGAWRFELVGRATALLDWSPRLDVVALDIPIGLPPSGRRGCDTLARERLGWPRRNSVFPAPVRAALAARTREEASRITSRADGRKVGAQAWALYPKIREVDALLEASARARHIVREVHPELSFCVWNGGPIVDGKKTDAGRRKRLRLAEAWLGRGVLEAARGVRRKSDVADDDILDAIAALWTATRVASGAAETLPVSPPRDERGRRMEIVY